jgi:hypothetical protein
MWPDQIRKTQGYNIDGLVVKRRVFHLFVSSSLFLWASWANLHSS